ncbi:MAG: cytochrome C oxidase subunit IV family protein, partial [Myxococcales bacterium]|nr:cytochrome C oxidase subunit IV family protein [Myxococcales bacterium]
AALMVLTVLTVSVTHFDMGYTVNLVVAMVIATIKASLVMLFFMHLWWDKRFNVLIFLGSFLFLALFVGLTVNDRGEYQQNINAYDDAKAQ